MTTQAHGKWRGTGGNRIHPADTTIPAITAGIATQLEHLADVAAATGRRLDLGEVSIHTTRTTDGRISLAVTADLAPATP